MGLALSRYLDLNKDICSICLDKPKNPQKQKCKHIFCKECIESMIKHNNSDVVPCPLCRKDINIRERYENEIGYIIFETIFDCGLFIFDNRLSLIQIFTLYVIYKYINNIYFLYGGLFMCMCDITSTIYSLYIN